MEKLFLKIVLFSLLVCCDSSKKKNSDQLITNLKIENIQIEKPNKINVNNKQKDTLILFSQKDRSLNDYKKNILIFSKLEKQAQTIDVESIIPINDDEFGYFYSLSSPEEYPESNLELYYEIDETMLDYALEDKGNCLFLYCNLVEFVDGEYAEYYFEAMENIVQNNVDKFCNMIYDSLSNRSKERLVDIYDEHCRSAN